MNKILIIKMSSLGDVIHTLPAITDLVHHQPEILIDWVVEEAFTEIPILHPQVKKIIPIGLRRWRRALWNKSLWGEIKNFVNNLRAQNYDLILDYQGLIKSALIACLAHGKSAGLDWRSARESLAALCYHQRYSVACNQHAVIRNRELTARIFGYDIPSDPPDYGINHNINQSFAQPQTFALPNRYVIFLHASSRANKNWSLTNWAQLGKFLTTRGLICLLPWGNTNELIIANNLAHEIPQAQVLPFLTLRELCGVLSGAALVIGVDTGLTHLAVALDRPTIALYINTLPTLTGVLAGRNGRAINLGNPNQIPTPDQVIAVSNNLIK